MATDSYLIPGAGIFQDAVGDQVLLPDGGIVLGSAGGPVAYTLAAGSGSIDLVGKTATLLRPYKVVAGPGAVAVSGLSVALRRTRKLSAGSGGFIVAGSAVALALGTKLAPGIGAFAFAGEAAGLLKGSKLTAGAGAVALSGMPADLNFGNVLDADPGSVTLSGSALDLLFNRKLSAGTDSMVVAGQAVSLERGYKLISDSGSVVITGKTADLQLARILSPGAMVISGQAATLLRHAVLNAGPGSITYTGYPIFLGTSLGIVAEPGSFVIGTFPLTGFSRTRVLTTRSGSIVITGSDKLKFKYLAAPEIVVPSTVQRERQTGSSMSSRSISSASHRGPSTSLSDRGMAESIERRVVKACPAGATSVIYVDRYVYVDGSMTTATVFEMPFAFGDATPQPIFSLLAGAVIAEVNVWILSEFNGVGASINIGRPADPDELMDDTEIDPAFLSSFSTRPGAEYVPGDIVNLTINPGAGATQGRGVLSVYVI